MSSKPFFKNLAIGETFGWNGVTYRKDSNHWALALTGSHRGETFPIGYEVRVSAAPVSRRRKRTRHALWEE